jgi:hypothetical protein
LPAWAHTLPIVQGWALYYYLQSNSHWGSKFPKLVTKSKSQDEISSQPKKKVFKEEKKKKE